MLQYRIKFRNLDLRKESSRPFWALSDGSILNFYSKEYDCPVEGPSVCSNGFTLMIGIEKGVHPAEAYVGKLSSGTPHIPFRACHHGFLMVMIGKSGADGYGPPQNAGYKRDPVRYSED